MASQQGQGLQKKPRLSLQIKTSCGPSTRATRGLPVDPKDPTAFNTLSNAYATAIERSTPLTAINTLQAFTLDTPVDYKDSKHRVATPYVASYPETPQTAHPDSPRRMEINYPSVMTATPPLSGTTDSTDTQVFTFSSTDSKAEGKPQSQNTGAQDGTCVAPYRTANQTLQLPYSHPQLLHSILRNSPLPPKTAIPPPSPRRQSLRLQEKAARRVGYNSPLEQEIVTNKYVKSHIDLLVEEASPNSPSTVPQNSQEVLDLALAFAPNEIQDGGQTPGPFEEMRRRVAGAGPGSPSSPAGIRKRKRREKKRRWVWTIGQEDENEDADEDVGGAVAAIRAEAARARLSKSEEDDAKTPMGSVPQITCVDTPTPSVESSDCSFAEQQDVDMTDASSVVSEDCLRVPSREPEGDLKTPTAPRSGTQPPEQKRDTPIPDLARDRDTPVPPEHMVMKRDSPFPPELR